MKIKNKYVIIIASLILIANISPSFWQVITTGAIGFFLSYLIVKIRKEKS